MSHGFWLPGLAFAAAGTAFILWAIWPLLRRGPCCGHDLEAHQHFRPGTECALCGCRKFRRGRALLGPLGRLRASGLVDEALRLAEQDERNDEKSPGGTR